MHLLRVLVEVEVEVEGEEEVIVCTHLHWLVETVFILLEEVKTPCQLINHHTTIKLHQQVLDLTTGALSTLVMITVME